MLISTANQWGIIKENKNGVIAPYGISEQIMVSELVNRIPQQRLPQDKSLCFRSGKYINKIKTQGDLPPLIYKNYLLRTIH